ncbi:hypothetical protein NDU88_005418 [Pleurodeles waltl]|uniref:C3H1-type domain-containing protein n=1 Tax=Pleurodeles waltl TaxID=8319 RepID=A0AAV7M9X3_PLEWA|nr:hypothetical protein NDU88_005418 [Pleurodeles waltl]
MSFSSFGAKARDHQELEEAGAETTPWPQAKKRAGFGVQETKGQGGGSAPRQTNTPPHLPAASGCPDQSRHKRLASQGADDSQGQPARRRDLAASTPTDLTGDSPLGDGTRVEDQVTSGDSPVGATRRCALALEQGNMENTEANVELDIEEIIKAAREAATTRSKDWILKQIRGAGSDEKKTRDERDDIRATGPAQESEKPPNEAKKRQRNTSRGVKKGDKREAGELTEAATPGPSKKAKTTNVEKFPHCAKDLWLYESKIHEAQRQFSGEAWLDYDKGFRLKMQAHPDMEWDEEDVAGYMLKMMVAREARNWAHKSEQPFRGSFQKSRHDKGKPYQKRQQYTQWKGPQTVRTAAAICYKFEKDECTWGAACKFRHVCLACGGHPAAQSKRGGGGSLKREQDKKK